VRHIVHIADLVGVAHVGIGMDYFPGLVPYRGADAGAWRASERAEHARLWNPDEVPEQPSQCAPGLETPAGMRNLTAALFEHGFGEEEVRQIMGENFLRVFRAVWK
jgi:membrane dipeptidase